MAEELLFEYTSRLQAFEKNLNEVISLVDDLLKIIKKHGQTWDIEDVLTFLQDPKGYIDDIKEQAPQFAYELVDAQHKIGWRHKILRSQFIEVKNHKCEIIEDEYERYIGDNYRIYNRGQVDKGQDAARLFVKYLNEANRYFNLNQLELPVWVGPQDHEGNYSFRPELIEQNKIKYG